MSSRKDSTVSASLLRELYARMLFTRVVDEYAGQLHSRGLIGYVASCRGHEAAQVGSTVCIEVGKDFTLPYYRDLGVVLTIGMSAYEVFRTYLQAYDRQISGDDDLPHTGSRHQKAMLHWGYHKHNIVTGPAPVAMQILHAAGIAFTCKLRKANAVTVAYCGDGATAEPDFLEGITFAVQHQLPVIFICEQDCPRNFPHPDTTDQTDQAHQAGSSPTSCLQNLSLPTGLKHITLDGSNIATVYNTMQAAIKEARDGYGPILLEMCLTRPPSDQQSANGFAPESSDNDPLTCCQHLLENAGTWDEQWAIQLYARTMQEVEQAMQDALRDCAQNP